MPKSRSGSWKQRVKLGRPKAVRSQQDDGATVLRAEEHEATARATARPYPQSTGRALREATLHLGAVSDTPRVEAEVLLTHVVGSSRATLLAHPERPLTRAEAARYGDLIRDRAAGQPLPHLTGAVEFYGVDLMVTPEVLIPRPDTEVLVDLALERCATPGAPSTIVDVGTGCGCIAIALALHLPEAVIYAIDISPPALAVARRNAEKHGVEKGIRFIVGDLLERRPGPVDLIVSNPPYVSADEWAALPGSIRYHEPKLALNGGPDGLEVIRRLVSQSQGLLKPRGALLIEIGANQAEAAKEIAGTFFPQDGVAIRVHPDLAGRDRVLEVQT